MAEIKGIINAKGKSGEIIANNGAYFVDLTNATESSGVYTIPSVDIENGDFTLQVGDILIDKDSGSMLKVATLTPVITASLVFEASSGGGGSQLYQHNILMSWTDSLNNKTGKLTAQITSSDDTPFTMATLRQWLKTNGFTGNSGNTTNVYPLIGQRWWSSKNIENYGMFIDPNDSDVFYMVGYENARQGNLEQAYPTYLLEPSYSNLTFVDTVIPL